MALLVQKNCQNPVSAILRQKKFWYDHFLSILYSNLLNINGQDLLTNLCAVCSCNNPTSLGNLTLFSCVRIAFTVESTQYLRSRCDSWRSNFANSQTGGSGYFLPIRVRIRFIFFKFGIGNGFPELVWTLGSPDPGSNSHNICTQRYILMNFSNNFFHHICTYYIHLYIF